MSPPDSPNWINSQTLTPSEMATIAEALTVAIQHHQGGRLQAAEQIYRQILQVEPNQPDALHLLGVIASTTGKFAIATEYIERALRVMPDHAEAHNNLGNALSGQGKRDEAIACYRRALALKPDYAEAHNNLGNALKERENLDEAVDCYRRALALMPNYAEAHNNLGMALKDQGKLAEAVACYRQAVALAPNFGEAHGNLGLALRERGTLDEAINCCRRALELMPDHAEAYSNLGVALADLGKLEEAAGCYRRALAVKPDFADARWNQALSTLLTGDFERGWAEYEWRWRVQPQSPQRLRFSEPRWEGEPLPGRTILVHAEQGLGDTIQFVRYLPLVKERGGTVLFECQPVLVPLLSGHSAADQLIPAGAPLPHFDVQAPLLSLPGILGTRLEAIPANVPYVRADPSLVEYWRKELRPLGGFKIGIAWQGSPARTMDRCRSFPLTQFASLARIKGVRLVSLQKGPGTEQLQAWEGRIDCGSSMSWVSSQTGECPIVDLGGRLDKDAAFLDTAALMMNLDLVVAVDSAVAHLAGALGVPAWVPLALTPDWRWLLERADSPWYPTMRLFRQKRFGEWAEVFERMALELRRLCAS